MKIIKDGGFPGKTAVISFLGSSFSMKIMEDFQIFQPEYTALTDCRIKYLTTVMVNIRVLI